MGEAKRVFFLLLKIFAGIIVLIGIAFGALLFFIGTKEREFAQMTDTKDLKRQIDQRAERYLQKRPQAALVVGVLQNGQRYIRGYGRTNETSSAAPDANTLFEIGSITKVFTAAVLARMHLEGQLELTNSVRNYLPKEVRLPEKDFTLKHLATHSSGLSRLPDNLFKGAKDQNNPYADYKASDLYNYLGTAKLRSDPGEKASYSNLGYGLLGHILELRAGQPYEKLVRELLLAPLNMTDTSITLTSEQKQRLTPGHTSKGKVVPNWDFQVLAPAGAFRSSAEDMLKFLEANLKTNSTPVSKALQETHKRHFQHWTGDCGLGWQIMRTAEGLSIRWHNGGTGGYVSFIGFDRQHQTAVVLLSNYGDAMANDNSLDKLSLEILKMASKISL